MNIQRSKIKIIAGIGAVVVIAVFGYLVNTMWVFGANGDLEANAEDVSGATASIFTVGEEGYLKTRAYSEEIPGYTEKLNIVLAVDTSDSMIGPKLERAKKFVTSFVDNISPSSDVYLGLVAFGGDPYKLSDLMSMSEESNRRYVKSQTDSFITSYRTDLDGAVEIANEMLIDSPRTDATRYIILVSDGGEAPGNPVDPEIGYINGSEFINNGWIDNINAQVVQGTTLDTSIDNSIMYRTVYIGTKDNNDMSNPDSAIRSSGNGGLMRFLAAKTNQATISENINSWDTEFGTVSSTDNRLLFLFQNENIFDIYNMIEGMTGVKFRYHLKMAPQVSLENIYYSVDKGGRSEPVTFKEVSPGYYEISTDGPVSYRYRCGSLETGCISNASMHSDGSYWIEGNYLDLKFKVKFLQLGSFDMLSNYTGCENGPLQQIGQDSNVEYIDPRDNDTYKTMYFSGLCIRVIDVYPKIVKTSYNADPGGDLASLNSSRQSSFEAGDDVWTVLNISGGGSGLTDWKIVDEVPGSVSGSVDFWYYQDGDLVKQGQVSVNDSELVFRGIDDGGGGFIGSLGSGRNYIKYRYRI